MLTTRPPFISKIVITKVEYYDKTSVSRGQCLRHTHNFYKKQLFGIECNHARATVWHMLLSASGASRERSREESSARFARLIFSRSSARLGSLAEFFSPSLGACPQANLQLFHRYNRCLINALLIWTRQWSLNVSRIKVTFHIRVSGAFQNSNIFFNAEAQF